MSDTINMNELQTRVNPMKMLLSDQQPGLWTWRMAFHDAMQDLRGFLVDALMEPQPEIDLTDEDAVRKALMVIYDKHRRALAEEVRPLIKALTRIERSRSVVVVLESDESHMLRHEDVALFGPDRRLAGFRAGRPPPSRYAGHYSGHLTVEQVPLPDVYTACNSMYDRLGVPGRAFSAADRIAGCSSPAVDLSWCRVIIPASPHWVTSLGGQSYLVRPEEVLAHELGHCNGWPEDHPR